MSNTCIPLLRCFFYINPEFDSISLILARAIEQRVPFFLGNVFVSVISKGWNLNLGCCILAPKVASKQNKVILSSHSNYYQYTMIRFGAGTSVASYGRELCRLSGSGVTNNSKWGGGPGSNPGPTRYKADVLSITL